MGIALLLVYARWIVFAVRKAVRNTDPAGFYVNGRRGSALNVGASILVSCVGASATLGMIGMAFSLGTPAFWWLGAGAVGLVLLSLLLAPAVRETGAYTMPQLVESVLGHISDALVRGEQVKISSFGTFSVRDKNERIGRNPKTGEEVPITPRRVLSFRPSHLMKDSVADGNKS